MAGASPTHSGAGPARPPSRLALMRASTAGVLDRALDVAAALEVRGYGAAKSPPRGHAPVSRHDLAFAASALGLVGLAVATKAAGLAPFHAYPSLRSPAGARELILAVALLLIATLPFADRRGIVG